MQKKYFFSLLSLIFFITLSIAFKEKNADNYSKIKLGELLFNEKLISKDSTVSCASCHNPAFAFSDTLDFSVGINGHLTKRNTPSVLNMKNRPYFFWDGRAETLAQQALMPIQNPDEMGLPIDEAIVRLNASAFYKNYFYQVFKTSPNAQNLSLAFEAYENTLETIDSKFDDWSNNLGKLSASEERGRKLFVDDNSKCFDCHFGIDYTNDDFKNIGLFNGKNLNDSGRYLITRDLADLGKFKTPGLRNIALTAPYMHNGMFKTLEEVVEYYSITNRFVPDAYNKDESLQKPIKFSDRDKKDLVAFLKTLSDKKYMTKRSRN
jgi:cytochrome c peroxidase